MIPSRIYILNLPDKPDRRRRLSAHLAELDLFPAERIKWMRAVNGELSPPPAWWKSGNGSWGCLMSHLHVVHDAIMDDVETCLVLEDDVVFHPRAKEMFTRLLAEVPDDWDQIYLGGQHLKTPEAVAGRPFVLRGRNVNRTHAFLLRRKAFAKYQQHILHAPDYFAKPGSHIDHQLGIAHELRLWNVYCPAWWLCGQEAGSSNISGQKTTRMWWHPAMYSHHLPFTWVPAACKNELPEEVRSKLHFGNNLREGTLEDSGLAKAAGNDQRLSGWLTMIAREAMDQAKLPALQHADITLECVRRVWQSGAWPLDEAPLDDWLGYPQNGLFPHPLNDVRPSPLRQAAGDPVNVVPDFRSASNPVATRILACCRASLREADILRFWLEYYRPHVDALLVTALLEPGDDPAELERLCRDAGALMVPDEREQFHCPQSMAALQRAVKLSPADWVVHADSDELLYELPNLRGILDKMEQEGADHAVAWMADRLAPGGKLAGLEGLHSVADMEAAFPVRAAITEKLARGCSYKVCISRWPFTGSIHSPQPGQKKRASRRLTLEHFKWRTGLEERLRKRIRNHRAANLTWGSESERLLAELETNQRIRAEHWLAPRSSRIPGGMDCENLYREAVPAAADDAHFVEVGVGSGRSLCYLAELMLACGKRFRIDGVTPPPLDVAGANLRCQGMLDYVHLIPASGPVAAQSYEDNSLDFVWLDGTDVCNSVSDNCRAWWPKIRCGGTLAGHDHDELQVKQAVVNAGLDVASLTERGGFFIARKPAVYGRAADA